MKTRLKLFVEKKYREIVKEIGKFRYRIFEKGETVPGDIYKNLSGIDTYNCAVVGTGDTISICSIELPEGEQFVIPKGEQVIVARLLRSDGSHGNPHYNADDQLIFPTMKGNIYRVPIKPWDTPDHIIPKDVNTTSIADAYKLPAEKSGPVDKYYERGAKLHVALSSVENIEKKE